MYASLLDKCTQFADLSINVGPGRRKSLDLISSYIAECLKSGSKAKLLFVCTHNSRRSQFAQVWLKIAAEYFGFDRVTSFSGGTEATAANTRTINALRRAGLTVSCDNKDSENPEYILRSDSNSRPIIISSKKISDSLNPSSDFGAVMVCTDADEACPFVPGADIRVSLPYLDPKHADNTPLEGESYDLASDTIAKEMFYIISTINKL